MLQIHQKMDTFEGMLKTTHSLVRGVSGVGTLSRVRVQGWCLGMGARVRVRVGVRVRVRSCASGRPRAWGVCVDTFRVGC